MEYEKCLTELDEILNFLPNEYINKIPKEIRDGIKIQKSKDYLFKYDTTKKLNEQKIDRKTISMLSYLNTEYLLNDEQKQYMMEIYKKNEQEIEKKKIEKYNQNNLFKKKSNFAENKEIALTEVKKDKWYIKMFKFIKKIFKNA